MIPYPGLTGFVSKKHRHVSSSYSCKQMKLNDNKKVDIMLIIINYVNLDSRHTNYVWNIKVKWNHLCKTMTTMRENFHGFKNHVKSNSIKKISYECSRKWQRNCWVRYRVREALCVQVICHMLCLLETTRPNRNCYKIDHFNRYDFDLLETLNTWFFVI